LTFVSGIKLQPANQKRKYALKDDGKNLTFVSGIKLQPANQKRKYALKDDGKKE
jgi:hypothetical protein